MARKDISTKLIESENNGGVQKIMARQKTTAEYGGKRLRLKRIRDYDTGYLKSYLKSRINKLPKKNITFLLANADLLDIRLLFF